MQNLYFFSYPNSLIPYVINSIIYFYVHTVHIDYLMFIIIIPTYAQVCSVKLILKLLRHVSVLIHRLQGVYSCVS